VAQLDGSAHCDPSQTGLVAMQNEDAVQEAQLRYKLILVWETLVRHATQFSMAEFSSHYMEFRLQIMGG
jgi:hypothetical protein